MKSIDDKTLIPISWAVFGLIGLIGPAAAGAMWVKGVNDRLSRIEDHLHIDHDTTASFIPTAHAETKPKK